MWFKYKLIIIAIFTAILFLPIQQNFAQAGDTLVVDWTLDGGQTVAINNLRNVILADTLRPEGRVYKLFNIKGINTPKNITPL